jgi:hypothetical protein
VPAGAARFWFSARLAITATNQSGTDGRRFQPSEPNWEAPRIHGELLKLGLNIGETSVSK